MATKQLQELGEFKVGQKVLMEKSSGMGAFRGIRYVEKITTGHGGTIFVDGYRFDQYGWQRGDSWNKVQIKPATDQDSINIKGANAGKRLSRIKWNKLPPEKVIEIEKLLNDNGINTEE